MKSITISEHYFVVSLYEICCARELFKIIGELVEVLFIKVNLLQGTERTSK